MTDTDTIATNGSIEVIADWAQASGLIRWRNVGDDEWSATVFQVADAAHKPERALPLVQEWLDAQA